MNDSTQYPFEEKPPRKNRRLFLLIPLILVVVLVALGIRYLQKNGASEALAGAAPDTSTFTSPPPAKPASPETTAVAKAVPAESEPAAPAPAPAFHPAKKHMKAQAPADTIDSLSALPPPKKSFALEDQTPPPKASLSDEGQLAMNTMPPAAEAPAETVATPVESEAFKQGVEAYHRQDYANAIAGFAALPKPTTRQRGNPTRDEYVQGNYLLGLSLLQSDRTADAVNAFLVVLDYEKYHPLANMNLGICYVELKQYSKANKAFEAVVRDQGYIESSLYDDVMQRTKYFWALAWTRMYKATKDSDKKAYCQQQALLRWKDYQVWFGKDARYRAESRRADGYMRSLSTL